MGDAAKDARQARLWFWGLFAVAVALRIAAFDAYAAHHPDEVLQYIEPAYRVLTGDGIVTWEYRYGMRGWLLPWLLAGAMAIGQAIGGSALAGIVAARAAMMAVALLVVVAAWTIGRRTSTRHGIIAMAVMAIWYEQIYWSTHLLSEVLSTSLFLSAAALINAKARRGAVVIGGALLTLAVVFRFQYAIAAAVLALLAIGMNRDRWTWLILGALPVVALGGAIDLVMGQWPYQWVWTNLRLNLIEGRSAVFGLHQPQYFLIAIWRQWWWFTPLLLVLAVEAGKPYRPLLFAAVINIAAHTLIGHKEYRFIMLSTTVFVLLAAIGSGHVLSWIERRRGNANPHLLAALLPIALWAGLSAWLGQGSPLDRGFGERTVGPKLLDVAGRDPSVCGLGAMTGGYWQLSRAYLGRPMPIILLADTRPPHPRLKPPGPELASINAVIAPDGSEPMLPGYAKGPCGAEAKFRRCLYRRPGICSPTPQAEDREIQRVLRRIDM